MNRYHYFDNQPPDEAKWIEEAKRDIDKFSLLYDHYFIPVFRFILKRVISQDVAADLCSQVFLKAMLNIKKYEDRGFPFACWLIRIAKNEVNLSFRNKKIMRKQLSLLPLLVLFLIQPVIAQWFQGGEITWECMSNGNYRFKMNLYHRCGYPNPANLITLNSNSPVNSITLYRMSSTDITLACNPNPQFPHLSCATATSQNYVGETEVCFYTSDSANPSGINLNGIIPSAGWRFSYSGCCRPPATNLSGSSNQF